MVRICLVVLLVSFSLSAMAAEILPCASTGVLMTENIFSVKNDVFLAVGPGVNAPAGTPGLPTGDYVFWVATPAGGLLSSDPIDNRRFHVGGAGVISYVYTGTLRKGIKPHFLGLGVQGGLSIQLAPCNTTPDRGGMYKVLVQNGEGRVWTATFQVLQGIKPYAPPVMVVESFNDLAGNGIWDDVPNNIEIAVREPIGVVNTHYTTAVISVAPAGWWQVRQTGNLIHFGTKVYVDGVLQVDTTANVYFAGMSGEVHEVIFVHTLL